MLRELSKVKQRYDAVLAVIREGMGVSEVAEKFVCIETRCTPGWPATRPKVSMACGTAHIGPEPLPSRCRRVIEARVLELRRNRPHWGPASLRHQLAREGVSPLPSISGIYRALLRHGQIEPKSRRKKLPTYKRWERGRAQADVDAIPVDDRLIGIDRCNCYPR